MAMRPSGGFVYSFGDGWKRSDTHVQDLWLQQEKAGENEVEGEEQKEVL